MGALLVERMTANVGTAHVALILRVGNGSSPTTPISGYGWTAGRPIPSVAPRPARIASWITGPMPSVILS